MNLYTLSRKRQQALAIGLTMGVIALGSMLAITPVSEAIAARQDNILLKSISRIMPKLPILGSRFDSCYCYRILHPSYRNVFHFLIFCFPIYLF